MLENNNKTIEKEEIKTSETKKIVKKPKTETTKKPVKEKEVSSKVEKVNKQPIKNKDSLLLEVINIEKNYGKVEVLTGINFKVNAGERIAIVGANGAGKSTLSEILAKVKEPSKGEIKYYFEKDGSQSHGKGPISSNIGIQFQDSKYPDFYKVQDLVTFIIGAAGIKITLEELENLYSTFDLAKLKKEVAKGLSGGQQQRLNILLAIVNNPKLLILDEVGTGLDVESRTKIKSYIKSYADEHEATILLVSHNSDEVIELVDRVIVIHNGLIYNDLPLKQIMSEWKTFDDYMNNLYLNVFKKDLDIRANKSGRSKTNGE